MGVDCLSEHCIEVHGWGRFPCTYDYCKYEAYSQKCFKECFILLVYQIISRPKLIIWNTFRVCGQLYTNCEGSKYCVPLEVSHWSISYWFIMNLVMSKLLFNDNWIILCNNDIGSHVTLNFLLLIIEAAHDKIFEVEFW